MPQAVVDPEELRQFARSLKKFNSELRDKAQALGNQLASLGTTWRDQEHKKFVEQFEQHMKILARFLETADQHVPYLLRKADYIEDYLQSS
jgi:WXG100 family type VII secretion target